MAVLTVTVMTAPVELPVGVEPGQFFISFSSFRPG